MQMQLSNKHKIFVNVLVHFSHLDKTFNISEKKMTLMLYVSPKLRTAT